MFAAVINNDKQAVRELISSGANVNELNENEETPLFFARDKEMIDILCDAGVFVNFKNKNKQTALINIVKTSDCVLLRHFLSKNVDVNYVDSYGKNALFYTRNIIIVKILLNEGIDYYKEILEFHKNNEIIFSLLINAAPRAAIKDEEYIYTMIQNCSTDFTKRVLAKATYKMKNKKLLCLRLREYIKNDDLKALNTIISIYNYRMYYIISSYVSYTIKNEINKDTFKDLSHDMKTVMYKYTIKFEDYFEDDTLFDAYTFLIKTKEFSITGITAEYCKSLVEDKTGRTLLYYADTLEIVKFLIKKGLKIDVKDNQGNTALYYATDPEIVKYLIQNNANLYDKLLFKPSSVEVLELIIGTDEVNIHHLSSKGQTCLFKQDNYDSLKYLIDLGVDPLVVDVNGDTAICSYIFEGMEKALDLLLDLGLSLTKPFDNTIKNLSPKVLKLFLDLGTDKSLILDYVNNCINKDNVDKFIEFGLIDMPNVAFYFLDIVKIYPELSNSIDVNGNSILQTTDSEDKVKLLIKSKADVSFVNKDGDSVLITALKNNKIEIAIKLIEAGADLTYKPFELLEMSLVKSKTVFNTLIKNGININALDSKNRNILSYIDNFSTTTNVNIKHENILLDVGIKFEKTFVDTNDFTTFLDTRIKDFTTLLDKEIKDFKSKANKFSALLDTNINVNQQDIYGNTIVSNLVKNSELEKLKLVLSKRKDVIIEDSLLFIAICNGDFEMVKYLVEECGIDKNIKDKYQNTTLFYAGMTENERLEEYFYDTF